MSNASLSFSDVVDWEEDEDMLLVTAELDAAFRCRPVSSIYLFFSSFVVFRLPPLFVFSSKDSCVTVVCPQQFRGPCLLSALCGLSQRSKQPPLVSCMDCAHVECCTKVTFETRARALGGRAISRWPATETRSSLRFFTLGWKQS